MLDKKSIVTGSARNRASVAMKLRKAPPAAQRSCTNALSKRRMKAPMPPADTAGRCATLSFRCMSARLMSTHTHDREQAPQHGRWERGGGNAQLQELGPAPLHDVVTVLFVTPLEFWQRALDPHIVHSHLLV